MAGAVIMAPCLQVLGMIDFKNLVDPYYYSIFLRGHQPRLCVLSSTNTTKVFVDGEALRNSVVSNWTPATSISTPGYIEVRNVTFNATARTTQGGFDGTKASVGIVTMLS